MNYGTICPCEIFMNDMISVIVVNYNGKRFLEKLFTSLRAQTYAAKEIICVDNASKDDSVDFIKTRFPEVRVIQAENKGYGTACNYGAREAQGQYVVFLNEDMHFHPDFLADMVTRYQEMKKKDPAIGALACTESKYDTTANSEVFPGTIDMFGFMAPNHGHNIQGAFIPGCPFFIARDLFLTSGGFCEHIFLYGDDTDLSWRLTIMGKHNYSAPDIHLYHYEGGSMEGFPPRKIFYLIFGTLVPIFNNYSTAFLLFFLPLNLVFTVGIIAPALLVLTRGNIRYPYAVLSAVVAFFRKVPRMYSFRSRVQNLRKIGDAEFLHRHFSWIPALIVSKGYKRL